MITIAARILNFVYRNMQMNLKSYLLKNQTFSAEFRPSPISTRVKQRSMPSDHAKKAYGNMQMNLKFFLIKNQVFSAEFHLSFQPTRSRGRCLSITIAPRRLNLKAFLLKKKVNLFRLITSISRSNPPKGGGQCLPIMITPHKLNFMHKNMQMNLKDLKV